MRTFTCVALALLGSACVPRATAPQHFEVATPLCEILADEQKFADKPVLVAALLFHSPHGRDLYSRDCKLGASLDGSSELWDKGSRALIEAARARDQRASIPVVVSGVFRPWTRYEPGKPPIHLGGGPAIEEGRIVAARWPW